MGRSVGVDEIGTGKEQRPAALGGAAKHESELGRSGPAVGGVGSLVGLSHLLR